MVKGTGYFKGSNGTFFKDPILSSKVHDFLNDGGLDVMVTIDITVYDNSGVVVGYDAIQKVDLSKLSIEGFDTTKSPRQQYLNQIDTYVKNHFEALQLDCTFDIVSVESIKDVFIKPNVQND